MAKISLEKRTRIHPCARTECLEVRALYKDKLDAPTRQRCLSYRRMGTVRKIEPVPKPKARGQKLKKVLTFIRIMRGKMSDWALMPKFVAIFMIL